MHQYIVEPGDTPAKIAIRFAGCPKCSKNLLESNAAKETVRYPNGYATFKSLRVGERLNLPDSWFNGEHDRLPPSYFKSLPYPDGVRVGVSGEQVGVGDVGISVGGSLFGLLLLGAGVAGGYWYATHHRRFRI